MKKKVRATSQRKKILWSVVAVFIVILGLGIWKVQALKNLVAPNGDVVSIFTKRLPGANTDLRGESEGRINIAVMGMRGAGVAAGGLLADTIMVVSITESGDPEATAPYQVSLLSVPRDLLVTGPDGILTKINAVFFKGERAVQGGGITAMKDILGTITGQEIHYGVSVNFEGFAAVIDQFGGVDVMLAEEFVEPLQFNEVHVCDGDKGGVFKIPTGETQKKYKKNGQISVEYPLCSNSSPECGGVFRVPKGESTLSGDEALCYVRSRMTSSDFDRARRQQDVITQLRQKVSDFNLVTDFGKIDDMLRIVGDNVQFDMELWELEKLFGIYKGIGDGSLTQTVLDDGAEGLLVAPSDDPRYADLGYILVPRQGDYSEIHALFDTFAQ